MHQIVSFSFFRKAYPHTGMGFSRFLTFAMTIFLFVFIYDKRKMIFSQKYDFPVIFSRTLPPYFLK